MGNAAGPADPDDTAVSLGYMRNFTPVNQQGPVQSNLQSQNVSGQTVDTSGAAPYNAAQQTLLGQLQNQAIGSGQNIAMDQFKQANQQNINQQAALAAGQQGNQNPGVQAQLLQRAAAANNQNAALNSAQSVGQQQLAAQGQIAGLANNAIGQQYGLGEANANLAQQADLANQAASNQTAQFNQAQNTQNNQYANQNMLAANAQYNQAYGSIAAGLNAAQAQANSSAIGGASAAVGAIGAAAAAAHGRVVQPAPGGKLIKVAEAGQPEAIVPLKSDGTPDKQQASGPGMKQLMSKIDTKKNGDGDIKDLMTKLLAALAAHKKSK